MSGPQKVFNSYHAEKQILYFHYVLHSFKVFMDISLVAIFVQQTAQKNVTLIITHTATSKLN